MSMTRAGCVMVGWAAMTVLMLTSVMLTSCGFRPVNHPDYHEPQAVSVNSIRLGDREQLIRGSGSFRLDAAGCLAHTSQYLANSLDAHKGQYVLQCTGGVLTGVQVIYPVGPASREIAHKTLLKLAPDGSEQVTGHDGDELKLANMEDRSEFFFFGPRAGGALTYENQSCSLVNKIAAWAQPEPKTTGAN